MRTASINIKGQEHLLCLSLKAIDNLAKRYGGMEEADKHLNAPDMLDAIIILAEMMNAGAMYAKLNDIPNPKPLSEEEIGYTLDLSDFAQVMFSINEAKSGGMAREVETVPKNAEATL